MQGRNRDVKGQHESPSESTHCDDPAVGLCQDSEEVQSSTENDPGVNENDNDIVDSQSITLESEENLGGPKFTPPLYKQRYAEVANLLDIENVSHMADFGSAEGKIISYLKRLPTIQDLRAVDIDESVISDAKYLCRPLMSDYLFPRHTPLEITLWQGDVTKFDERFKSLDAITMVEVIEHLNPDILEKLPENLFGNMQPRIVILTTPNAEFNVLFPGFSGFRHWDHKFEWTRAEFQAWCNDQAALYDYSVTFSGVGEPPVEREALGHCSQTAVFRRNDGQNEVAESEKEDNESVETKENEENEEEEGLKDQCNEPYVLVHESIHPFRLPASLEEQLTQEATYYIRQRAREIRARWGEEAEEEGDEYEDDDGVVRVSIEKLMMFNAIQELCDIQKLREVISTCTDYEISEDDRFVLVHLESEPEHHFSYSDSDKDAQKVEEEVEYTINTSPVLENWSDEASSEGADPQDKPWNNPENWNLPLEVTNPELWKEEQKLGEGYMQGFHQGVKVKKSLTVRFIEAKIIARGVNAEDGQFDNAGDVDGCLCLKHCRCGYLKQGAVGYSKDMEGLCDTIESTSLDSRFNRTLALNLSEFVPGISGADTASQCSTCDSTAAQCNTSLDTVEEGSNMELDLCYVPALVRYGTNVPKQWIKTAVAVLPGQFDDC